MSMWFWIKVKITQAWCALTGAHAVYVKDMDNSSVTVKVMREKFDPFVDVREKHVYFRKYGYRACHANGKAGGGAWSWRYVNEDLHVQHKLSN